MRVSLCFRTFIRSLVRTVMGNLLVSLRSDLTGVTGKKVYGTYRVFEDTQCVCVCWRKKKQDII